MEAADLVRRIETAHGPMLVFRGDPFVGRSLEEYGEFSGGERRLFAQLVQPGQTVVEAGAHIGAHTLCLARLCAPGRVYAFEPQPKVFELLRLNLALNGIENVTALNQALGAEPGRTSVPDIAYGTGFNWGALGVGGAADGGTRAPVGTVDELALAECHLIKADVEGFEPQVLEGARETIARCRPILYVENDREDLQGRLIALIHGLGYRMYWHTPPLFDAANPKRNPRNVFGPVVSANMLCLPAETGDGVAGAEPIDPDDWRSPIAFR